MDAETILRIKPALTRYLHEFDACMGRVTNCGHRDRYILGQVSDLQRKSIEPMADAAGVAPRTLQEFLSLLRWDEGAMRDRLQRRVARQHSHPHSVGIIDETSFHKQGNKTACVQRQYCGSRGVEGVRVLMGVLSLANKHDSQKINEACQTALTHGAYRLRTIRELIKRQGDRQERFTFIQEHPIIRTLGDYEELVHTALIKEPCS